MTVLLMFAVLAAPGTDAAISAAEGWSGPTGSVPITSDNVDELTVLARWGRGPVGEVAYSADGNAFALSTSVGVVIYDTATLAERRVIDVGGPVYGLALSSDASVLVTGGSVGLGSVRIWRTLDGGSLGQIEGTSSLAISPDGELLIVEKGNQTFDVWRLPDLTLVRRLTATSFLIRHRLVFSPDGKFVAAAGWQTPALMNVWRVSDGALVHELSVPTQYISQMVLSADGRSIATVSYDRHVWFWNLDDGELLRSMPFMGLGRLSPDASVLAVTRGDQVTLLRTSDGSTISTVTIAGASGPSSSGPGASVSVSSRAFSPAGDVVMVSKSGSHGEIHLVSVADGSTVGLLDGFTTRIDAVWLSPDGQTIMTAVADTVRVQSLVDGSLLSETTITPALAFSPDGTVVATRPTEEWSGSGPIRHVILRRLPGGEAYATLETSTPLAFSPDGSLLVTSTGVWHVADGVLVGTIEPPPGVQAGAPLDIGTGGCPSAVAISPDGTMLACGWSDGTLSLHRLMDRTLISTWQGHPGPLARARVPGARRLVFSPDGTLLLSLSDEGAANLWQIPGGTLRGTVNPHRDRLNPAAFTANGTVVLMTSQYGDFLLWPIGDGRTPSDRVVRVDPSHGQASWIGSSPDGRTVLTASEGTLLFWGVR